MNNVQLTDFISLSKAARLPELRRDFGSPHISTLWRWAHSGTGGVKLQVWKVGGRWFTTPRAVKEFVAKCNGEAMPKVSRNDVATDKALVAAGY